MARWNTAPLFSLTMISLKRGLERGGFAEPGTLVQHTYESLDAVVAVSLSSRQIAALHSLQPTYTVYAQARYTAYHGPIDRVRERGDR
jgi:hypothetical protein